MFGKDHHHYAPFISSIGDTLQKTGNHNEALKYYDESLALQKKNYGENSLEYARALSSISFVFQSLKRTE